MWPKSICRAVHQGMVFAIFPEQSVSLGDTQSIGVKSAPQTTTITILWLSPKSVKQRRNPQSGPPPVYQNLSTCHDWPVKKVMFDFPIRLKGTRNALPVIRESLGAWNKDIGAASQALDLLQSCFRSVCLLVPTSSLAFARFAFGAHAVDLWQVQRRLQYTRQKKACTSIVTGCRCGTDIFLFFFSFF